MSTHPMVTRAKAGICKPLERMNCHVTTTSPLPRSHVHALRDPNWKEDMLDEYNALITNGTLVLVPRPANVNVQQGIDCDETFSPVVKPPTIRTVLSLVMSREWPIHQLDVKNTFFHGHLTEIVYMHQPPGFVDSVHPDYVSSSTAFLQRIISLLHGEFAMTDLGSLNYFLGVSAQRTASDTESKLGPDGEPVSDPTLYRSLAGALQCLTFTRPNLSYVVQQVCLYMHDPRDPHFTALKRILRYVRGTVDHGLQLHISSTAQLTAYTDADWAGCPVTLSRSSAEAEYRGVVNVVAETAWL
ncbi:ribonuclease H-like domain-containing protein [Tanacetum coccineum]|uniref:Ribonuclease H-like domain-containing protein n=1 Tax=Tanacetum coccineum TaxID=301880 RepID=A0ABQ5AHW6_9ASTR